MERWPLVLGDAVLLVVALAGAVLTLVRARGAGGRATALAASACGVLVLAVVFDLVWWLVVESAGATGVLVIRLLTAVGVGLLIAAVRAALAPAGAAAHRAARTDATANRPAATGRPATTNRPAHGAAPAQPYQPAGGWTPPQQAHPNDWNVQSGVWSIPRGTFDGPPPDQR